MAGPSHGCRPEPSAREGGAAIKTNSRQREADAKGEHLGLDALGHLFCPWRYSGAKYEMGKASKKVSPWQVFTLLRRLAIFAAALVYISTSINASLASIRVLRTEPTPTMEMGSYNSPLIALWAGDGKIRDSPLVQTALGGSTRPRNETIYLTGPTSMSLTGCEMVPLFNSGIYSNTFLRTISSSLFAQAAYNLTFLPGLELIAPVVDCYFDGLLIGMQTIVRAHYLVHSKTDPDDVFLMTFSMSIQDYSIPKQKQKGSAGVAVLQMFNDIRASVVTPYYVVAQSYPYSTLKFQVYTMLGLTNDHRWRLQSIPAITILETPKEVVTASRSGFYINVETEQANIKNAYTVTEASPLLVLSRWRWRGGPVLRDSWGWVHCVHILFAADASFGIFVLFLVIYRNLVLGKVWVGDAFVSVSNTLMYRGAIVIVTWLVNDGWSLMEFCYDNANDVGQLLAFYTEPAIIRADLLTLFLSVASVVGYIFRERIDPAVTVFAFEIGFSNRVAIGKHFPLSKSVMTRFANEDIMLGTLEMSPIVAQTTPMRLWTIHELSTKSVHFIFVSLLPAFSLLAVVILYAICKKVYRHYYSEKVHILKVSDYSDGVEELQGMKRNLTLFEVATGAALQRRVGVVSDYKNCLSIKGMKYASADGIYCNGYVIANGKFLIATTDLLTIFLMKIVRIRFRNVYAYEVDGSTVQQTARLVYPQTIAWYDLLRLNISILS